MTSANHITHGTAYRAASEATGFGLDSSKRTSTNALPPEPYRRKSWAVLSMRHGLSAQFFDTFDEAATEAAWKLRSVPSEPCEMFQWDEDHNRWQIWSERKELE